MKNYRTMMLTREAAVKLIYELSKALSEQKKEVITLDDVDAPFILTGEVEWKI